MEIIETSVFTRQITELLADDEYAALQFALVLRPEMGSLIPGGGGVRKIRWGQTGRGKRGGIRVIYYWRTSEDEIYMLLAYAKTARDNLSQAELKALRQMVKGGLHDG
jgi:hypothetical protein